MSEAVAERVIVRVDADVDANSPCRTLDALADRTVQTIGPLLATGAQVVVLGSFGRPVSAPRDSFVRIRKNNPSLQLHSLADALAVRLGLGGEIDLQAMPTVQIPGYVLSRQLVVLENLAFDPREARNDQVLARQLAALGQRYVIDDARALNERTSSIASMPKAIPTEFSTRLQHELGVLDRLIRAPVAPFVAVIGGSHVARKLDLIRRLGPVVDELIVVGEVANTFLAARGADVRRTVLDLRQVDAAKQLGGRFENKLILPTDFVWRSLRIMDIGPQSRARFAQSIANARTVFVTGPAGVVSLQLEAFHHGTAAIAEALIANQSATRVVLGDDTVNQLPAGALGAGVMVGSGDVAALDFLATGKLVAIDAIAASRFSALGTGIRDGGSQV